MKYVLKIDQDTIEELKTAFKKKAGKMNASVDGVHINGSSHLLYCCAKGEIVMFHALQQLGSKTHLTDREVEDALFKIEQMEEMYGEDVSMLSVDNAAEAMARRVAAAYMAKHPGKIMLVNRDGGHCIDLPCKNSAKRPCMKAVLDNAVALVKFVKKDVIWGIERELIESSVLSQMKSVNIWPETRFYLAADTLEGIMAHRPFFNIVAGQQGYIDHYNSRTKPAVKTQLSDTLTLANKPDTWRQFATAFAWMEPFKIANKMTSSDTSPMSA